jgi:tetratricopeptide (TPR) repeat protein
MSTGVKGARTSVDIDAAPAVSVEEGLGSLLAIERSRLEAETKRTPWWKNITTLIAVLAFVLSGFSTWETVRYNKSESQTADRQNLVTLVDQLAQEPQSYAQLSAAYKSQPTLQSTLLSSLLTSKAVQAEEAGQIIDSLHGNVSSSAAREVASSFLDLGSLKPALHYATIALARAPDADLRADVLRQRAKIEFETQQVARGVADYRAAYVAETVPGGYTQYTINENHVFTDTYAFSLELNAGRCTQAIALYNAAVRLTPRVRSNPTTYQSDQVREVNDRAEIGRSCAGQASSALAPPPA